MPLAYTCSVCGHDLSRLAAPLDAVYRWPIVVCPVCTKAVVRRSDGHRLISRRSFRATMAVRKLVEANILVCIFALVPVMTSFMLLDNLGGQGLKMSALITGLVTGDPALDYWKHDFGPVLFGAWVIAWFGTGAYLTVAARHSSRPRVILFWLIPVLALLFLLELEHSIGLHERWVRDAKVGAFPPLRELVPSEARDSEQVLLAAIIVLPLGIPLGLAARRTLDGFLSRRFRRMRRRIALRRERA